MLPESLLESLKCLSADDLKQVADLIQSLQSRPAVVRVNPRGLYRDRGIHLSAEEIDEARRAVWGNFPRDIPGSSTR
jgi:hypothetical protein